MAKSSTKFGEKMAPAQAAAKAKEQEKKELRRKKEAEMIAALRAKFKAQAEKEKERQKAREVKKPKIIKPPPRGFNGFLLFVQDTKKPAAKVSTDWQNLSEEKKQEYKARAKPIAEKRKEEFDAFMKSVTQSDVKRYNRHQRSRGKKVIRIKFSAGDRPLPQFMRYMKEFRMRPDQIGKEALEVSKAAGEAWRSLSQEEKDKYKAVPSESTSA